MPCLRFGLYTALNAHKELKATKNKGKKVLDEQSGFTC